MRERLKNFLIVMAVIAVICAFVAAIAVPMIIFVNEFTEEERIRAANLACEEHGGVEKFDKYPGVDEAYVICRDGHAAPVLQGTVDP